MQGDAIFGMKMHWLHVAGANFVIICVLMLILSKVFPSEKSSDEVALKPETEGTWGMAKGLGLTVIILVFLIYSFLHNLGSV